MKNSIFFCLLISLFFISTFCLGQIEPKNVVKVNPIGLFLKYYSFSYERVLTEKRTFQIDLAVMDLKVGDIKKDSAQTSIAGYRLGVQYRYYLWKKKKIAPKGFYLAPFTEYLNLKVSISQFDSSSGQIESGNVDVNAFGLGFNTGYEWLIAKRFSIDLNIGLGYYFAILSNLQYRYAGSNALPTNTKNLHRSNRTTLVIPSFVLTAGYTF